MVGCGSAGDELWRLLLGFAPVTIGFCFLLSAVNPAKEVAQIMRWLALPLVVFVPLAMWPVVSTVQTATLGAQPLGGEAASWHAWWAPVQLVTLGIIAFKASRNWQASGK